jgi:hypothetical protein
MAARGFWEGWVDWREDKRGGVGLRFGGGFDDVE